MSALVSYWLGLPGYLHSLVYIVAVTLVLNTPLGRLTFITTITVFGAPHDVRLSEIAVETLLPADEATADALRGLVVG